MRAIRRVEFRTAATAVAVAALVLSGCGDKSGSNGDGGGDGSSISATCKPDKSVDVSTAIPLAEGKQIEGYICPRNDNDYYKVTLPTGKQLLRVKLQHTAPVTNVNLTYLILKGQKSTADRAPDIKGNSYDALHCLDPGTYYLLVQDDGNDAFDAKNAYRLSYSSEKDTDTNEPNDKVTQAKSGLGTKTGTIACTGDKDYFSVNVSSGRLLSIKLTTAKKTEVDLKYTVYQDLGSGKTKELISKSVGDGTKKPALLEVIYAVPKPGKYYVAIEDDGGDDGDPKTPYKLAISTLVEPDPGDKPTRNDHPSKATSGASYTGQSCSSPATLTRTGRIASLADVDYYNIGASSSASGAVIEVTVKFNGTTKVDPQVTLVRPQSGASCTTDACCRVLTSKQKCTDVFDCDKSSFSCIEKGSDFCDNCEKSSTSSCEKEKVCAGAVACLPSKVCGLEQFTRFKKDGKLLRTAHPIKGGGPWYIRVGDARNDEYDYKTTYTVTIKVCRDPDGSKEPNNVYFPRILPNPSSDPVPDSTEFTVKDAEDYLDNGDKLAKSASGTITGYISYEHDEDWYKIPNLCPSSNCLVRATFSTTGSGCPTSSTKGAGLEFVYLLKKGSGKDAWPDSKTLPSSGTFGGDGKCRILLRTNSDKTLKLMVSDRYHNNWSWRCGYRVSFAIAQSGCPSPCQTTGGVCHN